MSKSLTLEEILRLPPKKENLPLPPISNSFLKAINMSVLPPIQNAQSNTRDTGRILIQNLFRPKDEQELTRRVNDKISNILNAKLDISTARVIPLPTDIAHVKEAKIVTTSILHIDIRDSSSIIEFLHLDDALKVYQLFHNCVVEIINYSYGNVRTFAGDRIVALFDPSKEAVPEIAAVKTALLIDKMFEKTINPALDKYFGYPIDYGIGIDSGEVLAGRIGKYGEKQNNDIVWVGKPMNFASKLADFDKGIYLSTAVYGTAFNVLKNDSNIMWNQCKNNELGTFYKLLCFH